VIGANDCGRGVEGSGFVYAPNRLMTNAHVVAGVDDPEVQIDGDTEVARVVDYDPELDLAVLAVDTGDIPALDFDVESGGGAGSDDPVAIVGYPQDGPFDIEPGRVREEQTLRSPDIYGGGTVLRQVFSLRGLVRPGNSGGPLVSRSGKVFGVIFAASVSDKQTGYALTADQVGKAAAEGLTADQRVSSGNCA